MPWHSAPEAVLAMQKTAPQPFPKPAAGCAQVACSPHATLSSHQKALPAEVGLQLAKLVNAVLRHVTADNASMSRCIPADLFGTHRGFILKSNKPMFQGNLKRPAAAPKAGMHPLRA